MNASATEKFLFVAFMTMVIICRVGATFRVWRASRKHRSVQSRTSTQGSFYLLFAVSCAIFGGTVLEFFFVDRPYHLVPAIGGVAVFLVANWIRVAAIRTLGPYWSLHIEICEEHRLIQEGIYGAVRHPAYLSFAMEHLAIPLVGNAWWLLLVTVVGYVPLLWLRIMHEDKALVEKFGEPYRVYQREVGALWPRWSALWRLGKLSRSVS
jgi:protein-S-isoprenylcysteine O-methyltransferase Ste14